MKTIEDLKLSNILKSSSSQILEWKKQYTNIYYLKVGDQEYIFRLPSKDEYESLQFMQSHDSAKAEDMVLEKCILYPTMCSLRWGSVKAGEVDSLITTILSTAGFFNYENIKRDIEKERENIGLIDNQIVIIICKAFPHISPSDIDKFDYPTIIHYITLAEGILDTKLEITKLEDKKKIDFDKENRERMGGKRQLPPRRMIPVKK